MLPSIQFFVKQHGVVPFWAVLFAISSGGIRFVWNEEG